MPYLHEDKNFQDLLEKIHDEHGVDLTEYRSKCLGRRIYSRLRATQIDSIAEYINYLDENPAEYKNLMDAVTIMDIWCWAKLKRCGVKLRAISKP